MGRLRLGMGERAGGWRVHGVREGFGLRATDLGSVELGLGVARCGAVWRGVARCGAVWRGVAWCGAVYTQCTQHATSYTTPTTHRSICFHSSYGE